MLKPDSPSVMMISHLPGFSKIVIGQKVIIQKPFSQKRTGCQDPGGVGEYEIKMPLFLKIPVEAKALLINNMRCSRSSAGVGFCCGLTR